MTTELEDGPILTADDKPLSVALRKALFRQKMRALMLIAPLLLFVLITFVWPIIGMLFRSVDNSVVPETLPKTVAAMESWSPTGPTDTPPEAVYAAFAADMQVAADERTHTVVGGRLNYETPGIASKFRQLGREVKGWDLENDGPFKEKLIAEDEAWGELFIWETIKTYSGGYTTGYYASSVDRRLTSEGVVARDADEAIYLRLFWRTILMSLIITCMCALLGYPIAWMLSNTLDRYANLLLILVLLPFWTSLLVRTSAWKVLLQEQGVINSTLESIGIIDSPLPLMYNQFGTIVAMTHILLPFMILPMYSVMKTIPPSYLRAAKSLGANDITAFRRVYFPQSVPGIGAGAILTFILSIGYYITPEIVGGSTGIFISNRIAYNISSTLNWGLAAALGGMLLIMVMVLYWIYDRVVGIDNVKLG